MGLGSAPCLALRHFVTRGTMGALSRNAVTVRPGLGEGGA